MTDVSPQPARGAAPPLDSRGEVDVTAAITAFARLEQSNTAVIKLVASQLGLGVTDVRALVFLVTAADVTPKMVSEHLDLSTGATTSLVDRLDTAGYVERRDHPTDRRSTVIALAPLGEKAVSDVASVYRLAFREAIDPHYLEFLTIAMQSLSDSLRVRACSGLDEVL
jgi:DNA-binding MarR family transcriptional regulator